MILAKGSGGIAPVRLAEAAPRPNYLVDRVTGPEQRRLSEMGLVEGASITVITRANNGMLVVKIGGCRLALARGMAEYVWVK